MTRHHTLGLAAALALMIAVTTGLPAQAAAKPTKAVCAVDLSLQASPGLSAVDEPQRFAGTGDITCRVKPNDPQLFQGILFLQTYGAPHGSCTAGTLEGTQLVMIMFAPDGDFMYEIPIVHASWDHALLQGSIEGHSGTLTGAFLPLLPSLCLPNASGRATGVQLAFELSITGFPIYHP